jgi:hypothetical protein
VVHFFGLLIFPEISLPRSKNLTDYKPPHISSEDMAGSFSENREIARSKRNIEL